MLTSIWVLTVDPKVLESSFMRPPMMLAMQSSNSMVTTGTGAFSRSASIASPTPWEAVDSADAEALVVVAASAGASRAVVDSEVAVDSAVATADAVATAEVPEVPQAPDTQQSSNLLWPPLRMHSPTMQQLTEREARLSMFAT